jgi:uncharacterized Zn finger protein
MGFGWRPYVRVADRRRKAEREMIKRAKSDETIQPVRIEGKAIAKTFWGKAWCRNLESYSDFENRLPRGRTYLRNGSVCHLEIASGEVRARVSGSALYTVKIDIAPLGAKVWNDIKRRCTGKIASLLDLLGGKLADAVMEIVTDREQGLFPKPRQISMSCSCPDWADMCKHVAAVLYGVGARLDEEPELLFLLRGVHHEDLVSEKIEDAVASVVKGGSRRRVAESELSEVFGVDMDVGSAGGKDATRKRAPGNAPERKHSLESPFPAEITGRQVRELRERLGLTGKDFAQLCGVSGGAVSVWERSDEILNLRIGSRCALKKAWKKGMKAKRNP